MPRSSAGTVLSAAEKSRTCSSWICCFTAGIAAGLRCWSQPLGLVAGADRSATRLRFESAASAVEYGSVTVLTTTFWTLGAHTVTWYR